MTNGIVGVKRNINHPPSKPRLIKAGFLKADFSYFLRGRLFAGQKSSSIAHFEIKIQETIESFYFANRFS